MTIDIPQGVGFVLTAFSIMAILVPYIYQQNPENGISDERRDIQSLYVIQNKNSTLDDKVWAYNRFNDFQNIENIYNKLEDLDVNKTVEEKIKLAATVAYFNNNNDDKSKTIFEELKQNKSYDDLFNQIKGNKSESDFLYKVWYTERLIDSSAGKQQHEDVACGDNQTKQCVYTQEELLDIRNNISDLVGNGYTINFERKDIVLNSSLHESIKKFIDDFHTFIIVSFITGPIIFFFTVKYYSKIPGMKKE